jgi:cytochrome c biogenesis protein CcdA
VFDPDIIRNVGAVVLVLVGALFIVPQMKDLSAGAFQKLGNLGSSLQNRVSQSGAKGEFLGGALLGLIWSPCTGPTLAIAIGLASQAQSLAHASLIFFFFGLGAGLGLVVLGLTIKQFNFVRQGLMKFGKTMNLVAGILSLTIGVLILLGLEGDLQEFLLQLSPQWLTNLTVSI